MSIMNPVERRRLERRKALLVFCGLILAAFLLNLAGYFLPAARVPLP